MSNDKPDPSTTPTVPAQQAQGRPPNEPPIRVITKDDEAVQMLQAEYPGAPRWGLQVLHKVGKVESVQEEQGKEIAAHGARLDTLDTIVKGGMRPRAPSLTGMREEDVAESFGALSATQQNQVVAKGIIRSRKQTNTQTGLVIGALVTLAGAGAAFLQAQADRTRQDTAHAAEVSAREAAAAAAKAAAEAIKHPGATTP